MMTPPDPIGDIQADIQARLTAAFTGSDNRRALRVIEPIDAPFDGDADRSITTTPPAIYMVPLVVSPGDVPGELKVRWAVYAVASAATSKARTTGTANVFGLGAYAIAVRAALVLDQWCPGVTGASMLDLGGIENLTGLTLRDKHLHVWAVTLDGRIQLALQNETDAGINADDLADFLTFHGDFDIAPLEDLPASLPAARDAALTTELPQ